MLFTSFISFLSLFPPSSCSTSNSLFYIWGFDPNPVCTIHQLHQQGTAFWIFTLVQAILQHSLSHSPFSPSCTISNSSSNVPWSPVFVFRLSCFFGFGVSVQLASFINKSQASTSSWSVTPMSHSLHQVSLFMAVCSWDTDLYLV